MVCAHHGMQLNSVADVCGQAEASGGASCEATLHEWCVVPQPCATCDTLCHCATLTLTRASGITCAIRQHILTCDAARETLA